MWASKASAVEVTGLEFKVYLESLVTHNNGVI